MITEFDSYNKPLDSHLEHPLCNSIVGILKGSHVGKNKSIKALDFSILLTSVTGRDISVRALRQGISKLRMKGEPICSWGQGYYYMNNNVEMNLTIQSLMDRMTALAAEVAALSAKYVELYGNRPELDYKDLKDNIDYLIPIEDNDQKIDINNN